MYNNNHKFLKMNRVFVILMCCVLVSCRTQEKIVYLQDVGGVMNNVNMKDSADLTIKNFPVYQGIVIQPKDIISIVVSSRLPELARAFNLPYFSYQALSTAESSNRYTMLGYTVDVEGNIDFPIFEKLPVAGLTKTQLAEMIKQRLIKEDLIKDPIVTVDFMNFKITVLGEVRTPGTFNLPDDKITIFQALGRAGDLTIYGRRDNVLVQREENGEVKFYYVDLRSASIIHSPAYFLQQNDVVYVTPNNTVAARSRINENRTLGVGISLTNFLVNMILLLTKL